MDKTIEMKEQEVNALILQLYADHHVEYQPMYPWVFVRVLPKIQKIGMLWTPDKAQNKPVHEGMVLATWKPFTKEIGERVRADGVKVTRTIEMRSEFNVGDHVMFMHHSGHPVPSFDDKYYRGLMERGWDNSTGGGIFGTVDRGEKEVSPHEILSGLISEVLTADSVDDDDDHVLEVQGRLLASKIEDRFHLIDNQRSSVTLSGV